MRALASDEDVLESVRHPFFGSADALRATTVMWRTIGRGLWVCGMGLYVSGVVNESLDGRRRTHQLEAASALRRAATAVATAQQAQASTLPQPVTGASQLASGKPELVESQLAISEAEKATTAALGSYRPAGSRSGWWISAISLVLGLLGVVLTLTSK